MNTLTGILIITVIFLGMFKNRKNLGLGLRITGVVIAISSFALLLLWVKGLNADEYRFESASSDFSIGNTDSQNEPNAYSLTLAIGEIGYNKEKWYFSKVGTVEAVKEETNLIANIENPNQPRTKKVYRKGISRSLNLSSYGISINIGWDDAGGEFLIVKRGSRLRTYMRTFGSYFGVFPNKKSDFAATRLFISGKYLPAQGSVFGYPNGKMGFLIVQPVSKSETESYTVQTLFKNLHPFSNPYRNSNNIESFYDARKLLVRGASFSSHKEGVTELLSEIPPIANALFFLVGFGVFLVWIRNVFPGILLGLFLSLLTVCSISRQEFDRSSQPLIDQNQVMLYSAIATAANPLWKDSANQLLHEHAGNSEKEDNLLILVRELNSDNKEGKR